MISTVFLEKVLDTLEEALKEYDQRKDDLLVRDGVIQRYEYCYELSLKVLEKCVKQSSISENGPETIGFKKIIRKAARMGWIDSPEDWFNYRDSRNKTSHAYSAHVAEEVFESIEPFLASAKDLLNELKYSDH